LQPALGVAFWKGNRTRILVNSVMQLFPQDLWADDVLGRKAIAQDIERLLSLGPGVLNIDAPYGHGKTFLLSRLSKQLAQSGYHCICIDAWSSDFHTDPVLVLFSEFNEQLASLGLAPGRSRLAESAKAVGKILVRHAVPAAVKITTLGVVDLKDIADQIEKASREEIAKAAGEIGSDFVSEYIATKKSVEEFRRALEDAVGKSAEMGSKIVVIIDELDRCRPDYALRVLEVVKHLFLVPGLTFLIAADVTILARAVHVAYGIGSDAVGYLGRLIDFTVKLPIRFDDAASFAEHLVRLNLWDIGNSKELAESFAACTRIWSPSLRDQVRAFRTLAITLRLKPNLKNRLLTTIITLVCFKLYAPKIYIRYVEHVLKLDQLLRYFGKRATATTWQEIASQSHTFYDTNMGHKLEIVANLFALQMVDDAVFRTALEVADWRQPILTPGAVTPFGKYAPALHRIIRSRYEEFRAIDHELYAPPSLRGYLDEEISIIG
jgi:hypothetical protein